AHCSGGPVRSRSGRPVRHRGRRAGVRARARPLPRDGARGEPPLPVRSATGPVVRRTRRTPSGRRPAGHHRRAGRRRHADPLQRRRRPDLRRRRRPGAARPMTSAEAGPRPRRRVGFLGWTLRVLAWAYPLALLAVIAAFRLIGERWWPVAVAL